MKEESIAIIVPIYNVERYLNRAIESVINQTYKNLKIILVDDGSTDGSGEICDTLETADERIKVIHQQNGGVSCARNTGMAIANSEYLMFLDPDDWLEPNAVEILYNLAKKHNADISVSNIYLEYESSMTREIGYQQVDEVLLNSSEAIREIMKQDSSNLFYGHVWNKLFKCTILDNLTFEENIYVYEDLEFVFQAMKRARIVAYSGCIGYHYLQQQNSVMHSRFTEKTFSSLIAAEKILNCAIEDDAPYYSECLSFYVRTNLKQASLCSYTNCKDKVRYLNIIREKLSRININLDEKIYLTFKDKLFYTLLEKNIYLFDIFYRVFVTPQRKKIENKSV